MGWLKKTYSTEDFELDSVIQRRGRIAFASLTLFSISPRPSHRDRRFSLPTVCCHPHEGPTQIPTSCCTSEMSRSKENHK